MKILYINFSRGAGVFFIGKLFQYILEYIHPIELDIYESACLRQAEKFELSKQYDVCICNEVDEIIKPHYTIAILLNKIKKQNIPIINIAHNTGISNKYIDYSFILNGFSQFHKNYFNIPFISGNIWKNLNKNNVKDLNYFLIPLRLEKIDFEFLRLLKTNNPKVQFDVYCILKDEFKYLIEKNKDIINYKGFVQSREMVEIYNSYKNILLPSKSECLSMPIREALACERDVYVYLPNNIHNYAENIYNYIFVYDKNAVIISEPRFTYYHKFSKIYNMENMILQFLFYLRGLLCKELYFDKSKKNNSNILTTSIKNNDLNYDFKSVINFDELTI